MLIGTISTHSYLPKAIAMARSAKKHMPDTKVVLCLLEREMHSSLKAIKEFDSIILAKELGIERFDRYIFRFNKAPASFSLKGKVLEYMFKAYKNEEKFIYLDSDIKIFSPLKELAEMLDTCSIVLTPHILNPIIHPIEKHSKEYSNHHSHLTVQWRELGALKTGLYQAGMIATRRTENSEKFIQWWNYRLDRYCYRDYKEGLNYDQGWLDLVPCFFDAKLLKHPGYNVAFWNLSERDIRLHEGQYFVNAEPLRFYHYSGIGGLLDEIIKKNFRNSKDAQVINSLIYQYIREIEDLGISRYQKMRWSYDYYLSGEEIKPSARDFFRDHTHLPDRRYDNPFAQSNAIFTNTKNKMSISDGRYDNPFAQSNVFTNTSNRIYKKK